MKILFHNGLHAHSFRELHSTLHQLVSDEDILFTQDTTQLTKALLKFREKKLLVLLYIFDWDDVAAMKGLQDLLDGMLLIVVVCSRDKKLFESCLQLYPRFLTYKDENDELITAIVKKRLNQMMVGDVVRGKTRKQSGM